MCNGITSSVSGSLDVIETVFAMGTSKARTVLSHSCKPSDATFEQDAGAKRKVALIDPKPGRPIKRPNHAAPPVAQRPTNAQPYLNAPSSFNIAVLGGQLWCAPCRAAAQEATQAVGTVPLHFSGLRQYLGTFEPLLFDEARNALVAEYLEVLGKRKVPLSVTVKRYHGGTTRGALSASPIQCTARG